MSLSLSCARATITKIDPDRKADNDGAKHTTVALKIELKTDAGVLAEFHPELRHAMFKGHGGVRFSAMEEIGWKGTRRGVEISTGGEWIEGNKRAPMSYRRAADHVRSKYMLRLDQAPFDVKALYFAKDKVAPIAGSCVDCPKRTGNAPDLFGDVGNDNVCTDPQCFGQKREAQGAKVVEEAKAKGLEVLTGKDALKVLPYAHSRPAGFVKLDEPNYRDEKNRTWAKLLGKEAKDKIVLCERPDEPGTFVELVREKDVNAILKAKGIEHVKAKRLTEVKLSPAEIRHERERQITREVNWQAYLALREVIGREGFTQVELRAIALDALRYGTEIDDRLLPYWGLATEWTEQQAEEAIQKADGGALLQLVCDMTLGSGANSSTLAGQRGIDVAAIEAKVTEELKSQAKAAKKPAKGKTKDKVVLCERPDDDGGDEE